jgi:hypothetical protein
MVARKWWHKLYWGLLDGAIVNSYILAWLVRPELERYDYMLQLATEMINWKHVPEVSATSSRSLSKIGSADRFTARHFPDHLPLEQNSRGERSDSSEMSKCLAKYCVVCSADNFGDRSSGKRAKKSMYCCRNCKVVLCITPCFRRYHTEKKIAHLDVGPYREEF